SNEIINNAKNINQLNNTFSRLYTNTKEYDLIRSRERNIETKRLRPLSFRSYNCPIETPEEIMKELVSIHKRTEYYALCSGGKDSISVGHWIMTNFPEQFKGFVHIKTNIGVKKTTDWLIEYCEKMGWVLKIIEPKPPNVYDELVLKYGFPSAGAHTIVMRKLKYSTMRRFAFENPHRKFNHSLISGIRVFESSRRMNNYKGAIQRDGNLWFTAPFFKKSDEWVYKYLLTNGLKRTPVHDILGMSGECECGSFASYGEREKLKLLDPELMHHIEYLEDQIQLHGTPLAKKYPKWGNTSHTPEEVDKIMKDLYSKGIIDKIKDLEEVVCGVECGAGTMRGLKNV
ncbi:hypothetical protein LCGC14_2847460, partial [marine sediment metagenome]